ncbi:unnamed protein product, partial [Didymodactylos carnosus]
DDKTTTLSPTATNNTNDTGMLKSLLRLLRLKRAANGKKDSKGKTTDEDEDDDDTKTTAATDSNDDKETTAKAADDGDNDDQTTVSVTTAASEDDNEDDDSEKKSASKTTATDDDEEHGESDDDNEHEHVRKYDINSNSPLTIENGRGFSLSINLKFRKTGLNKKCVEKLRELFRRQRKWSSDDCVPISERFEDCLSNIFTISDQLSTNSSNATDSSISSLLLHFPQQSQLYCSDTSGDDKLVGIHHQTRICLAAQNKQKHKTPHIIYEFDDLIGLSAQNSVNKIRNYIHAKKGLKDAYAQDCEQIHHEEEAKDEDDDDDDIIVS